MSISTSPEITVTEEWIEARFPDAVDDVKVLLRQDAFTRVDAKSLGFEREEIDDRTVRWNAVGRFRPQDGDPLQLKVRWNERGQEQEVDVETYVGQYAGGGERQPAAAAEPPPGREYTAPSAGNVRAMVTARGSVIVLMPHAVAEPDLEVGIVGDEGLPLDPGELDWQLSHVAHDAIELVPLTVEAMERPGLEVHLRFPGEGGDRREETVAAVFPRQARRDRRGDRGGYGGGNGGTNGGGTDELGGPAPAPRRRGRPRVTQFGSSVLDLPFRVADSGGRPAGGDPGRTDAAAFIDSIVGEVLPRLGRGPSPRQFRDSLEEFSARGGAPAASPYISGVAPGAAAAIATPGPGMRAGDLGSPFAMLLAEADALERIGLPVIQDVGAIVDDTDQDLVEARRTLAAEAARTLIEELRRPTPDGPEVAVVIARLTTLQQQVAQLGQALGIDEPGNAISPADLTNVSRFSVLQARIAGVALAIGATDAADEDPRVIIGDLEQLLGVIDENTRELSNELELAGVGPQERATIQVEPPVDEAGDQPPPITFARLEQWISDEAGRNLPYQLGRAGRIAGAVAVATLEQQQVYVDALQGLVDTERFPWNHPIVARVVGELSDAFGVAIDQARLVDPTSNE